MFLGVDAGGTTCRARLVSDDGEILGIGRSNAANTRLGAATVMASIKASCLQALRDAGVDRSKLSETTVCVGLAGYSRTGVVESLGSQSFCQEAKEIIFVSDIQIAHVGAHSFRDGGTVVVGTGSVAIATVGEDTVQVGGKGFPVSDLGSGAHMGLLAVQRALLANDAIVDASSMTDEILRRADTDPLGLRHHIDGLGPTELAAHAPLVIRHAEAGDEAAIAIMTECAGHVSDMLSFLHGFGAPQLCLVGGLATTMGKWISEETRALQIEPLGDPIDGAIAIARLRVRNDLQKHPLTRGAVATHQHWAG